MARRTEAVTDLPAVNARVEWHRLLDGVIKTWDLDVPDFAAKPPGPDGHVPACIYGCCWKLPGETWEQAKKHYRAPKEAKAAPPLPPSEKRGPHFASNGPRRPPMPPRTWE